VIEMMTGWNGMGVIGILLMAVFWVAVLAAIVLVVHNATDDSERRSGSPRDAPEDVLKARYGRGDIGREEYEQTLRDIAS
jgi:uncharacterized membrane protein